MLSIHNHKLNYLAYRHYLSIEDMVLRSSNGKEKLHLINVWLTIILGESYNLRKLITANPTELENISIKLKGKTLSKSVKYLGDIYENYFSGSSKTTLKIDNNAYKASHFVRNLELTVCPYCNRNYIFNVSDNKKVRRLSELDHFYPKETHPALYMSFYNLVPVCHNCNHIKSNSTATYINPYKEFISDANILFRVKIKGANFITNPKSFKLGWKLSNDYQEMFYDLKLHRIYPIHKEIILDIIKKKYIYTDRYVEDVVSALKSKIYIDKNEFVNSILSANIQENKLKEKPFSKLTKDIWNDLSGKI